MRKTEIFAVILVTVCLTVPLAYVRTVWLAGAAADTAFLYQIVENLASRGLPYTQINASVLAALPLWIASADDTCNSPLNPPEPREINQFDRHAYFILFLIVPLAWVIPASVLIPTLTAFAFVASLTLCYLILRSHGASIRGAALFCLLVSVHPAWSQGVMGQPYVDRFFLPLALLFMYTLWRPVANTWLVLGCGTLACLTVERAGYFLAAVCLIHAALGSFLLKQERVRLAAFGVCFAAWSVLIARLGMSNADNMQFLGSLLDLQHLSSRLHFLIFEGNALPFVLFNVFFLGVFAFAEPILFVTLLVVLLPNLLGTVGGAELDGWGTHYHSYYFPVIVAVSALGFARLSRGAATAKAALSLNVALVALIVFSVFTTTKRPVVSLKITQAGRVAWFKTGHLVMDYLRYPGSSRLGFDRTLYQSLRAAVPDGSTITAPEGYFGYLYGKGDLHYFPIAIDSADYAVLDRSDNPELDGGRFTGAVTYLGPENRKQLNGCLNERLERAGYDLGHPVMVGNIAVLKRQRTFGQDLVRND